MLRCSTRRWFTVVLVILALPVASLADNGPHTGDFSTTTDACAGCHRAHRGKSPRLLKEEITAATGDRPLCFTCHGGAGQGADTNVEDGVYMNRASGGQYGVPGAGLRGGGFVNALMDPDMDGTPTSAPATSQHSIGEVSYIWGLSQGGPGKHPPQGKPAQLWCSSCHNPHGYSNADYYRVLRPDLPCNGCHQIRDLYQILPRSAMPEDDTHRTVAQNVYVPDESPKTYTVTYQQNGYRDVSYINEIISQWCTTCHTRYLASDFGDTQDEIFTYRHKTDTDQTKCLVCHVAHGTAATMGMFSGSVEWPDGSPGGGSTDSRLLHVNNRGVCIQCHPSP